VTGGRAGGGHGDRQAGGGGHGGSPGRGHSALFLAVAGALAVLLFVVFVALGTWQLKRRVWKLDLIARVEQRVHALPMAAPGPAQWPQVTAATDEYRHVTVTGTFLDESQTLVQAVTDLGAGYWVLTPLRTANGSFVLVNRGFVSQEARNQVARASAQLRDGTNATAARATAAAAGTTAAAGGTSGAASRDAANPAADRTSAGGDAAAQTTVAGLLRMTEPRGAFLRHNDAAANHWYSRDVQAIAAARGLALTHVAPYFIDADAAPQGEVASRIGSTPSAASAPSVASTPSVAPQRVSL